LIQTVIDLLNEARLRELEAIHQYMLHENKLKHQESDTSASRVQAIVMVKMKHAEKLAERISFLKRKPLPMPDGNAQKHQEISEMLASDIAVEERTIKMYQEASGICAHEKDPASKNLFEEFLRDEQSHLNIFATLKAHMDKLGISS
jgi:bacterioferritin